MSSEFIGHNQNGAPGADQQEQHPQEFENDAAAALVDSFFLPGGIFGDLEDNSQQNLQKKTDSSGSLSISQQQQQTQTQHESGSQSFHPTPSASVNSGPTRSSNVNNLSGNHNGLTIGNAAEKQAVPPFRSRLDDPFGVMKEHHQTSSQPSISFTSHHQHQQQTSPTKPTQSLSGAAISSNNTAFNGLISPPSASNNANRNVGMGVSALDPTADDVLVGGDSILLSSPPTATAAPTLDLPHHRSHQQQKQQQALHGTQTLVEDLDFSDTVGAPPSVSRDVTAPTTATTTVTSTTAGRQDHWFQNHSSPAPPPGSVGNHHHSTAVAVNNTNQHSTPSHLFPSTAVESAPRPSLEEMLLGAFGTTQTTGSIPSNVGSSLHHQHHNSISGGSTSAKEEPANINRASTTTTSGGGGPSQNPWSQDPPIPSSTATSTSIRNSVCSSDVTHLHQHPSQSAAGSNSRYANAVLPTTTTGTMDIGSVGTANHRNSNVNGGMLSSTTNTGTNSSFYTTNTAPTGVRIGSAGGTSGGVGSNMRPPPGFDAQQQQNFRMQQQIPVHGRSHPHSDNIRTKQQQQGVIQENAPYGLSLEKDTTTATAHANLNAMSRSQRQDSLYMLHQKKGGLYMHHSSTPPQQQHQQQHAHLQPGRHLMGNNGGIIGGDMMMDQSAIHAKSSRGVPTLIYVRQEDEVSNSEDTLTVCADSVTESSVPGVSGSGHPPQSSPQPKGANGGAVNKNNVEVERKMDVLKETSSGVPSEKRSKPKRNKKKRNKKRTTPQSDAKVEDTSSKGSSRMNQSVKDDRKNEDKFTKKEATKSDADVVVGRISADDDDDSGTDTPLPLSAPPSSTTHTSVQRKSTKKQTKAGQRYNENGRSNVKSSDCRDNSKWKKSPPVNVQPREPLVETMKKMVQKMKPIVIDFLRLSFEKSMSIIKWMFWTIVFLFPKKERFWFLVPLFCMTVDLIFLSICILSQCIGKIIYVILMLHKLALVEMLESESAALCYTLTCAYPGIAMSIMKQFPSLPYGSTFVGWYAVVRWLCRPIAMKETFLFRLKLHERRRNAVQRMSVIAKGDDKNKSMAEVARIALMKDAAAQESVKETDRIKNANKFLCICRRLIPLMLLIEGTSSSQGVIMTMTRCERILLGYACAVARSGYIWSPLIWLSCTFQLILVLCAPSSVFCGHLLFLVGLTSIRLTHYTSSVDDIKSKLHNNRDN